MLKVRTARQICLRRAKRLSPSLQKPDGLIFPDRATLYVTAIEDRQYKDYKIHCEYLPVPVLCVFVFSVRAWLGGRCIRASR